MLKVIAKSKERLDAALDRQQPSDLVEVKGIDLKLDEPMIYKVGTPKLKEEMTNLDWMK